MQNKKKFEQWIALNFLPLVQQDFSFFVYRKQIGVGSDNPNTKRDDGVCRYRLPKDLALQTSDYVDCDVSFNEIEGFEKVKIDAHTNIYLTKFLLMEALQKNAQSIFPNKIIWSVLNSGIQSALSWRKRM